MINMIIITICDPRRFLWDSHYKRKVMKSCRSRSVYTFENSVNPTFIASSDNHIRLETLGVSQSYQTTFVCACERFDVGMELNILGRLE